MSVLSSPTGPADGKLWANHHQSLRSGLPALTSSADVGTLQPAAIIAYPAAREIQQGHAPHVHYQAGNAGTFGVVASTHWLASQVGMAVLERGGNAFDAAVAAGFTLHVAEPHLNGPGGDAPVILHSAASRRQHVICGQGVSPAAASIQARAVHVDNAGEFPSSAFTRTLEDFGVEVIYRPIARPHFGGHIERLIGTAMGAVHVLRGTTFSSVKDRGSYPAEGRATMTLRELERWLALEILGKYHHRVHSALQRPPLAVWAELSVANTARMPRDRTEFLTGLLPYEMRLPRRDGFRLFNIRYWSDALVALLGRHEQKLMVRYDPRDLSRVWVRRPDGRHVEARYKNLGREPISLWEHSHAMERLRSQGRKEVSEEILFRAIREQRRIEDEALRSSKLARRSASQRPIKPEGVPVSAPDLGVIDTSDPNLPTLPSEIVDGRRRG
jgi:putative transposase